MARYYNKEKLPFDFTPHIFRYLETLIDIAENTWADETGDEISIDNYVPGEPKNPEIQINNGSFWHFLEEFGTVKISKEKGMQGLKPGTEIEVEVVDMRANSEITEGEFKSKKTTLLSEKERFQDLLKDTDRRVENWLEIAERGFNYAEKAAILFAEAKENDNFDAKREIFAALGSDLILKDKKLNVSLDNLLFPIQTAANEARKIAARLEPAKKPMDKKKIG